MCAQLNFNVGWGMLGFVVGGVEVGFAESWNEMQGGLDRI